MLLLVGVIVGVFAAVPFVFSKQMTKRPQIRKKRNEEDLKI